MERCSGGSDLRKGFEGLFGLVKDRLELEPLSGNRDLATLWPVNRLNNKSLAHPAAQSAALQVVSLQ